MLQNVQGAKDKTALLQQHHVFVMTVQLFKVSTNDGRMMLAEKQYKLFHLFFSEKRVGYGGDNFSTTTGLQLIHHYRASRARGWRLAAGVVVLREKNIVGRRMTMARGMQYYALCRTDRRAVVR